MATERWEIDSSHSWLQFSVRHLVIGKVRGQLTRWSATAFIDGADPARARVDVLIDAASIDTGVADRDEHLRSKDFFDVARYPEMTFRSARVETVAPERLRVAGSLTIRDVTREVVLDVECCGRAKDPWGNDRAAFTAAASFDRADFGLTWNRLVEAGVLVGDRVEIDIEVEAVRQPPKAAWTSGTTQQETTRQERHTT
jgi:polyisoprenoid-binding protein YceI